MARPAYRGDSDHREAGRRRGTPAWPFLIKRLTSTCRPPGWSMTSGKRWWAVMRWVPIHSDLVQLDHPGAVGERGLGQIPNAGQRAAAWRAVDLGDKGTERSRTQELIEVLHGRRGIRRLEPLRGGLVVQLLDIGVQRGERRRVGERGRTYGHG